MRIDACADVEGMVGCYYRLLSEGEAFGLHGAMKLATSSGYAREFPQKWDAKGACPVRYMGAFSVGLFRVVLTGEADLA